MKNGFDQDLAVRLISMAMLIVIAATVAYGTFIKDDTQTVCAAWHFGPYVDIGDARTGDRVGSPVSCIRWEDR